MSFYYEADIYLISVGWQFWAGLLTWAAWNGGRGGEGTQAGKCGLVVGDVCVTFSPSWYPTLLL